MIAATNNLLLVSVAKPTIISIDYCYHSIPIINPRCYDKSVFVVLLHSAEFPILIAINRLHLDSLSSLNRTYPLQTSSLWSSTSSSPPSTNAPRAALIHPWCYSSSGRARPGSQRCQAVL
jgi:hypothetical protein